MHLIGLSGKKQSGKDSVYIAIKKLLHPHIVRRLGFADELKYELANACGTSLEFIENNKTALRLLLQSWGTDFRRNLIDKDYWINKLSVRLLRVPDDTHTVVITDVRFLNEAKFIKELGGILIRVHRGYVSSQDMHISETDLDNFIFNYTINNTGTLEDLDNRIKDFLSKNNIK